MRIGLAVTIAAMIASGASQAQSALGADALDARALEAYDAGDARLAAMLWRQAAKAGSADAMTAYAGLREAGDGVAADAEDARRWYARAARRDEPHAMVMLADRIGDAADPRARALLRRAAALGHPYAIRRLSDPPRATDAGDSGG